MSNSSENLRTEMNRLGAREFELVALSMDADRGLAALAYAQSRGVDNPVPYAIKIFDSPDWNPKGENRRVVTNASVDCRCDACGGDRFVPVTEGWQELYAETYAPCAACNANADATFWTADGRRHATAAR